MYADHTVFLNGKRGDATERAGILILFTDVFVQDFDLYFTCFFCELMLGDRLVFKRMQ